MRFALLLCGLLIFSACQRADITPSGTADDNFFLKVRGFKLPVHVAGNLDSRKMVILLHGGPGGNSAVYRNSAMRNIMESQFAIVYLDQRSAGASQGNGTDSNLEDFREDIRKLIVLLRDKYGQDQKIYLLGHSWGGFLAPYFLLEYQNMVQGWIQVGGAHRGNFNSLVKDMLIQYGNNPVYRDLNPTFWDSAIDYCNSTEYQDSSFETMTRLNQMAHKAEHILSTMFFDNPDAPNLDLFTPLLASILNQLNSNLVYGFFEKFYQRDPVAPRLADIKTPALLMWGKYDFVCPSALSDELINGIGSSDITRIIYFHSGHSPMIHQSLEFWEDAAQWVNNH